MQVAKDPRLVIFLCQENSQASGNRTTVNRIKGFLEETGYQCLIQDPRKVGPEYWDLQTNCLCVFAIHAWHCSTALKACSLPYVIIFGGTDLNEYAQQSTRLREMTPIVEGATFLVSFGGSMTATVNKLWTTLKPNVLKQIPQSVKTSPSSFNLQAFMNNNQVNCYQHIFILVASIRLVKDPLFLVPAFSEWHKTNPENWLVIVGERKEEEYFIEVQNIISNHDGVLLLPTLKHEDLLAAVKSSFALVNSSLGEGMSAAILEAMDLGTPVIARNVSGNQDLILHNETGFLYETPDEFISIAQKILQTPDVVSHVVKNAREIIATHHGCQSEAEAYLGITNHLHY